MSIAADHHVVAAPAVRAPHAQPRLTAAAAVPSLAPTWIVGMAFLLCGLLLINKLGGAGAVIFFGALAVMMLRSPEMAFLALMLSGLGLLTNMALVPKTSVWTVARLAILFVALLRFSIDLAGMRRSLFGKPYYWALLVFVAVAAACSVISGYYTEIALLKLLNFAVGMSAVFAGWLVLHARQANLAKWFVAMAGTIVINGFLAMVLGVGYGRSVMGDLYATSSYFQGPFFHPNACGPFCALLVVLLFSTWLFSSHTGRWICMVFIPPLLYFMWLSRSRTGIASLAAGILLVVLLTYMPAAARYVRLRLNTSRTALFVWAALIGLGVVVIDIGTGGGIAESVTSFLYKTGRKADALDVDSILYSRQGLINRSWALFLERPWTGLGFQVSVDPYFVQNATLFSAPVEKGFLPTALLEEVGIIGTVTFVLFILLLVASLWRQRNAPGLAMLIAYVITNFGEVTIFAFGGPGLLAWMLVAAAALVGDHCLVHRAPASLARPVPL